MSRHAGLREGEVHGREQGRLKGLRRERSATVGSLLAARNIRAADRLFDALDRIVALPHEAVIKAVLERDFRDFLRRLAA